MDCDARLVAQRSFLLLKHSIRSDCVHVFWFVFFFFFFFFGCEWVGRVTRINLQNRNRRNIKYHNIWYETKVWEIFRHTHTHTPALFHIHAEFMIWLMVQCRQIYVKCILFALPSSRHVQWIVPSLFCQTFARWNNKNVPQLSSSGSSKPANCSNHFVNARKEKWKMCTICARNLQNSHTSELRIPK